MKPISTPSEKAHALVNPSPVERNDLVRRHRTLILFKNVFGLPIPMLMLIFAALLPAQTWFSAALGWVICCLSIMYIFVDRFSNSREFRFFPIGGDLPILLFVVSTFWGIPMTTSAELLHLLYGLSWILFIYMFAYTLDLFPGLNHLVSAFFGGSLLVGVLAIYQTVSGQPLVPWLENALTSNSLWPDLHAAQAVYDSAETFALVLPLLLALPLSAWLLSRDRISPLRIGALLSGLLLSIALLLNLRFETLFISAAMSMVMVGLTKKKYFLWLLGPLLVGWFAVDYFSWQETLGQHLMNSAIWSWDLRQELNAQQLKLFAQSPWLGVGYAHNRQSLFEFVAANSLGNVILNGAPNTYFQMLVTTGVIGLVLYLFFVLSSLLVSHRLLTDIPKTHYWHRVFVLGSLGVQIGFHLAGLFVWTFGYSALTFIFAFHVALVAYMAKRYQQGIVPDDQAL